MAGKFAAFVKELLSKIPKGRESEKDTRMLSVMKFWRSFVFILVGVGIILFWLADPLYLKAPSDRKMLETFNSHRVAFERLSQMEEEFVQSDKEVLQRNYKHKSSLNVQPTEAWQHEHDSIVSTIPYIHKGDVSADWNGMVRYRFAGGGILAIGSGWEKGIV